MKKTLAALMTAAVVLTGCGVSDDSASSGTAHTLRLVTVYPANTTDPHVVQTAFILTSGTVETLVKLDIKTGALTPGLATAWTQKGKTWQLTIRDGVTFHNGKPLTAQIVQQNIDRAISKNPGVKKLLPIESMKADGQTLTITTDKPYAGLMSEFIHFNTAIIDPEAGIEKPVGTGPFKFDSFNTTGAAELSRFDAYWGGKAKLERVTMTANQDANARLLALQSGEADVIYRPSTETLDGLKKDDRYTVETRTGTRVYHLLFNYKGPQAALWAKEPFRRGIDALMDRPAIAKTVMSGYAEPTDNPFPGKTAISPGQVTRPSGKEAALKYFQQAGLEVSNGKVTSKGKPLTMNIVTYVARPELPQIAQVMENSASQVGISFKIVTADNIDEHLTSKEWDVATYSANTVTRGDGSYFIHGSLTPGGAQNHGQLDDPALNKLIEQFNSAPNTEERATVAKQLGITVRERQLNSYLVAPMETAAFAKGVTGWQTPTNEFEYPMITKDLDRA